MKLNNNPNKVIDMPKLQSPFIREVVNGVYVCVPKINEQYRWVFTEEAEATEKLDGTNVSIVVKDGKLIGIYNRTSRIDLWTKGSKRFMEGILEAIDRGIIDIRKMEDGQYFGELIGESVNGNPYRIKGHIWLPFDYIRKNLRFKFWDEFVKELEGKSDEEIYKKVSELFESLWSLYKRKLGFEKTPVNRNVGFEGMAAEGIVFYRKGTNEMCKLRRDMFDWFVGKRHKEVV
jgi:hypothetical protein